VCRLLAYHSPKPTTFNQLLGDDFQSFVELANQHCDGWGIATSSSSKAKLYKEPLAATESDHFETELAASDSAIALLHLRWATPGFKSTPEYYQINYTTINGCVVVGSSGWNQDNWSELKNSTALIVNSDQSYRIAQL